MYGNYSVFALRIQLQIGKLWSEYASTYDSKAAENDPAAFYIAIVSPIDLRRDSPWHR